MAESSGYTQLGLFYDLLDGNGFDNYLIMKSKAIEMTEVALRSRQVAAASSSDLCSQVAALDWR